MGVPSTLALVSVVGHCLHLHQPAPLGQPPLPAALRTPRPKQCWTQPPLKLCLCQQTPDSRFFTTRSFGQLLSHGLPDRSIIESGPPEQVAKAFAELFTDKIAATKIACAKARQELGWPARA